MDLKEFRGLPECKEIHELQYRVTIKPGVAMALKREAS